MNRNIDESHSDEDDVLSVVIRNIGNGVGVSKQTMDDTPLDFTVICSTDSDLPEDTQELLDVADHPKFNKIETTGTTIPERRAKIQALAEEVARRVDR